MKVTCAIIGIVIYVFTTNLEYRIVTFMEQLYFQIPDIVISSDKRKITGSFIKFNLNVPI